MNKDRRTEIASIADAIRELQSRIETVREEEQDYFDAMPESFQAGDKGDRAQAAVDALDEAISEIETALSSLETAGE